MTETAGPTAILVVYYLAEPSDLPILREHLDRIERHTKSPFVVYAATERLLPGGHDLLAERHWVRTCELSPVAGRGSREHGAYLDQLARQAMADGCLRLVTLDVDSFPIDDRWLEIALAGAEASGVAGIVRTENGDTVLPHPSWTVIERSFWEAVQPSFSPDSDFTPDFRRFLRTTGQAGDTGLGLAYALWSRGIEWHQLRRTNVRELHPVIAGIYADSVFHLAGVASGTLFRRDLAESRPHRLTRPIERVPVPSAMQGVKRSLLGRIRGGAEARIKERNRVAYDLAREWLLNDADGLIAYLRGDAEVGAEWVDRLPSPSERTR